MAEPAVSVTPVDAETKEPIEGVLVTAREGSYADTSTTFFTGESFIPAHLAPERSGTYQVTAKKKGFTTWTLSGVVAEARECGPATVEITASLSRRSHGSWRSVPSHYRGAVAGSQRAASGGAGSWIRSGWRRPARISTPRTTRGPDRLK